MGQNAGFAAGHLLSDSPLAQQSSLKTPEEAWTES
jgi:hypothetical protein